MIKKKLLPFPMLTSTSSIDYWIMALHNSLYKKVIKLGMSADKNESKRFLQDVPWQLKAVLERVILNFHLELVVE